MPGWLLPAAIGLGSALSSYGQSRRDDRAADLSEEQLAFLKQKYANQEPLRALGLSRIQGKRPERPDLTGDFADASNPFAKAPGALGFGKGYTSQAPDMGDAMRSYRGAITESTRGTGLRTPEMDREIEAQLGAKRPGESMTDYIKRKQGIMTNVMGI